MLIYGNYNVSITAEKTITGGIPKSWCDYSPEVTCGLHPHHISGVTIIQLNKMYSAAYLATYHLMTQSTCYE